MNDTAIKAALREACDQAFRQAPPGWGCNAYERAPAIIITFLRCLPRSFTTPEGTFCERWAMLAAAVERAAQEAGDDR